MTEYIGDASRDMPGVASRRRQRWPDWIGYAAAAWSLIYGVLGVWWTLGGAGFPFGSGHDPNAAESILANVRADVGAPAIAGLGLLGALVALAMARATGSGLLRWTLLGFSYCTALALLVLIPDRRVLMAVAYAPIFLLGAPFGWPPVSFWVAVPWPVINQGILISGGLVWVATGLGYGRRTRGACAYCGRSARRSHWTTPGAAARWGRWAVAIAVAVPVLYAATRWAWALGIPFGISEAFLREGQASGLWIAGAGLATVAVCGAILTLGLIQRWGEVFPRWTVRLAGKRVPPALAIVPAGLVSVIVTAAGIEYVRHFLESGIPVQGWATTVPELAWPLWGPALGAATLAYYYRRRGRCAHCGRL